MLHAGSDDMITLSKNAENGDVERLGAVFGENHPFEAPAVEIVGERASAVLDDGGAGKGELMAAPPGICAQLDGGRNGGNHGVGLASPRRRVVEIDHEKSPLFL